MKIKFIKPTAGIHLAYHQDEEAVVSDAFGMEMIELGYAVMTAKESSDLPEDFPGRKVLIENGIETIEEVKKIATVDQLTGIKGIGKKTAEQIVELVSAQ
jgi:hypothetical protein